MFSCACLATTSTREFVEVERRNALLFPNERFVDITSPQARVGRTAHSCAPMAQIVKDAGPSFSPSATGQTKTCLEKVCFQPLPKRWWPCARAPAWGASFALVPHACRRHARQQHTALHTCARNPLSGSVVVRGGSVGAGTRSGLGSILSDLGAASVVSRAIPCCSKGREAHRRAAADRAGKRPRR